jgi:hypothetical protein
MESKLKKLEKNFIADFHVIDNASAPVIINLKKGIKIDNKKIKEFKVADHNDYS